MTKIDIDKLKERIYYDLESGAFINIRTGNPAGTIDSDGYTVIKIDGKRYQGTHIAHAIMEGSWPTLTMDHKDRNPTNNKWVNLREATHSQQNCNQGKSKRNTSGVRGVCKDGSRWRARICVDNKYIQVGNFSTFEEAKLARMKAELEHYGVFSPLVS